MSVRPGAAGAPTIHGLEPEFLYRARFGGGQLWDVALQPLGRLGFKRVVRLADRPEAAWESDFCQTETREQALAAAASRVCLSSTADVVDASADFNAACDAWQQRQDAAEQSRQAQRDRELEAARAEQATVAEFIAAGKALTWRRGAFTAHGPNGYAFEVGKALLCPEAGLAIDKREGAKVYTVSHLGTGYACLHGIPSQEWAKGAVANLVAVAVQPWPAVKTEKEGSAQLNLATYRQLRGRWTR